MKVALVMIICSQVAGECMKPHFLKNHDSFSECLIGGYEESIKKIKELGKDEVNKHEIVVKFKCYYDTSTLEKGA
mgnify:CR=1 FL=1